MRRARSDTAKISNGHVSAVSTKLVRELAVITGGHAHRRQNDDPQLSCAAAVAVIAETLVVTREVELFVWEHAAMLLTSNHRWRRAVRVNLVSLNAMTVEQVRRWVAEANSITVFSGAGVSTASGIPDYRGPQGAWTKDPDSSKYVDIDYYVRFPHIREESWRRRRAHPAWRVQPNEAHSAIVGLERAGKLNRVVTQNIDGLHQAAGSSAEKVLEIHGNLFGVVCLSCKYRTRMETVFTRLDAGEADPDCPECGGILKSGTIFFGQQLDTDVLEASATAAHTCDLMLAIGTSLTVFPAAGLVDVALDAGARVVVCNAEPTPYDHRVHAVLHDEILDSVPRICGE